MNRRQAILGAIAAGIGAVLPLKWKRATPAVRVRIKPGQVVCVPPGAHYKPGGYNVVIERWSRGSWLIVSQKNIDDQIAAGLRKRGIPSIA